MCLSQSMLRYLLRLHSPRFGEYGTIAWPQKTRVFRLKGKKLRNSSLVEVEVLATGVAVGEELDVAVDFISPRREGRFVSFWSLISPLGDTFGQLMVVLLRVMSPEEGVLDGRASSSVVPASSFDSDLDEDSEDDDLPSYFA
ncbi:protein JOKA2-like [Henckelia pumila]|uniref:protein JOKA2-like n=1 Tax=Henckelia pumila TaxID=405737 RepID=UPI003C6E48FE